MTLSTRIVDKDGNFSEPTCNHEAATPPFDQALCEGRTSDWVRQHFPRFYGQCPTCGSVITVYASYTHFLAGDW